MMQLIHEFQKYFVLQLFSLNLILVFLFKHFLSVKLRRNYIKLSILVNVPTNTKLQIKQTLTSDICQSKLQ